MKPVVKYTLLCCGLWLGFQAAAQESEAPQNEILPDARDIVEETLSVQREERQEALPAEALSAIRDYFTFLADSEAITFGNLEKRVAMSPFIGKQRRVQLLRYQQELKSWLEKRSRGSDGKLDVLLLDSRAVGDLGVAVVSVYYDKDLLDVGVISVMLCRNERGWMVAPFVSSFSNADLPMDSGVSKVVESLEEWASDSNAPLLQEALSKSEENLSNKLKALRAENKLESLGPSDLLQKWLTAVRTEDVLMVAAIGEIEGGKELSAPEKLEQATSYVLKEGKERGMLPFTFALSDSDMLVVNMPPKGDAAALLGLINLTSSFPSRQSSNVYEFKMNKDGGKQGHSLMFFPKVCSANDQRQYADGSDLSDDDLEKQMNEILKAYVERLPERKYDDPLKVAEEYTEAVSRENKTVEDYFSLLGKDRLSDRKMFEAAKGYWLKIKSAWEYPNRMKKQHKQAWTDSVVKRTKMVKVNEENSLFFLIWYSPAVNSSVPMYSLNTVVISKEGDAWRWNIAPNETQLNVNQHKLDFIREVNEAIKEAKLATYTVLKKDQVPALPEKALSEDEVKGADESLMKYLEERFARPGGMEEMILDEKGLILEGDKEPPSWVNMWRTIKSILSPAGLIAVHEKAEKAEKTSTLWAAVQHGDWGAVGLAFREEKMSKLIVLPLVRVEGKWNLLHTALMQSGSRKDIYTPKADMIARNNQELKNRIVQLNKLIYFPLIQAIINKKLLPESEYSAADHEREKKAKEEKKES